MTIKNPKVNPDTIAEHNAKELCDTIEKAGGTIVGAHSLMAQHNALFHLLAQNHILLTMEFVGDE